MKVGELIDILERYNKDEEIVLKAENSGGYVDTVYNARIGIVRAFWGPNYQAVILEGNQVGHN